MLDASELPPTYGIDPSLVRVLMAGGERAFLHAVEGAEDDEEAAIEAVNARGESGGCRRRHRRLGHDAVHRRRRAPREHARRAHRRRHVDIRTRRWRSEADIADRRRRPAPRSIMGSSRMKSGTAQKLVLNTISTGVMIRLGRVYSNLMIDMPATNEKAAQPRGAHGRAGGGRARGRRPCRPCAMRTET